ncbi:MAG: hypothetical protein IKZ53_06890 [Selenomonadaceae bacterium]|nr:hypothetical protein [Selenomonadaceae bacterium]
MDETIKILREQTVISSQLPEVLNELIKVMRDNSPEVQEPIKKIESLMRELSANEKAAEEFLKKVNAPNFAEYIAAQNKSLKRDVAEKLLEKAAESQAQLKKQSLELKALLQKGKEFVEFNLNILARTSASGTYSENAQRESQRNRRMFEANI